MTVRYSHLSPAHLADAMKTIGSIAEDQNPLSKGKTS
jgi:hypothetical protein